MCLSRLIFSLFIYLSTRVSVYCVPPEACFAPFKWQDCGREPTPVMYYWKPGSRCEVGLWRGCLPNINMFKDEYECVSTCIFAVRAYPRDYHNLNELSDEYFDYSVENTSTAEENVTTDNATTGNDTADPTNKTDDANGKGDGSTTNNPDTNTTTSSNSSDSSDGGSADSSTDSSSVDPNDPNAK